MLKIGIIFLFFFSFFVNHSLFAKWIDRKAEGWAWYEDKNEPKKEKAEIKEKPPLTSSDEMALVRKSLEDKLAKAMLEPTAENIKIYMEEQQKWIERSSQFASIWTQVLLNQPQLDYTATVPVSQYGLKIHKESIENEKQKLISSLSKEYGLFFFYEGRKEHSIIFAKIVKEFAKKQGFEVIAISVDDVEIDGFASNKKNNGIATTLGVKIFPALYLINPVKDIAIPIAFGLVAMDQIENNIVLQFKEMKNHD